ncbi:MAG: bifunctional UDP-sugar hydrolase/5'-nucleotidase [Burkholderiales bacterium]
MHADARWRPHWRLLGAVVLTSLGMAACATTDGPVSGGSQPVPKGTTTVTIAHINDTHGRYLPVLVAPGNATAQTGDPGRSEQSFERRGLIGGYAAMASALARMRARVGTDNLLMLHGGDAFGDDLLGNLTRGEATIRLMNAIGVDFMALGNHDFDYGAERTRELQGIAAFPMRGANVTDASGEPFLGDPAKVFEAGGVRIAVLALGYHNTDQTGSRDNLRGLAFGSGIDAARTWVPRLRGRADVILVLSHQGSKVDRELARAVPGIDVIVGAHSHDEIAPPERVGDTWLVQAMSDATELGELTLNIGTDRRLQSVSGQLHTLWADDFPADTAVAQLIERLRAPHRAALEATMATASERIGRRYKSESPFDALGGEILREHTGADIAFLPGVGYGVSLEAGTITREALGTLLPHPAKVATVVLSGRQVREVLEQSATNQKPERVLDGVGGLVQTSGLIWTIDLTHPVGQRVRDIRVGNQASNQAIDPQRDYRVVTHEGMLKGLHRYRSFAAGREPNVLAETVTEVVEAGFRQRGTVRPPPLGNVTVIQSLGN